MAWNWPNGHPDWSTRLGSKVTNETQSPWSHPYRNSTLVSTYKIKWSIGKHCIFQIYMDTGRYTEFLNLLSTLFWFSILLRMFRKTAPFFTDNPATWGRDITCMEQPAKRKRTDGQTHTHTDAIENMTSSADAGGKNPEPNKVDKRFRNLVNNHYLLHNWAFISEYSFGSSA